jgi:putative ABC transport system substrate-binding protein
MALAGLAAGLAVLGACMLLLPIVFVGIVDPVGLGIVASLANPGSNITGSASPPASVFQKELHVLDRLVPGLSLVAIVLNSSNPSNMLRVQATATAANAMGVQLKPLAVRSREDVEAALAAALAWQAEAMMLSGNPSEVNDALPRFVDFEVQNRIPATHSTKEGVQAGVLLSYTASFYEIGSTSAGYVDKIIKGARPADPPVAQPTVYELVVNQTTARALGITIPPEVVAQVTEWVS